MNGLYLQVTVRSLTKFPTQTHRIHTFFSLNDKQSKVGSELKPEKLMYFNRHLCITIKIELIEKKKLVYLHATL